MAETTVVPSTSGDLRNHWSELEQFKQLLDRIERGMEKNRQADESAAYTLRKRSLSARFRLWR